MKLVIFAGGYGSRLGSITAKTPKPMVKILNQPIIWHIMKYYSLFGIHNFIILSGYKHKVIEKYFNNKNKLFSTGGIKWNIKVINTGLNTMTGGRLKRAEKYLKNEKNFCLTYGDGLSDVNIKKKIEFHKKHNKLATILAVHPPSRFGFLNIKNNLVTKFEEKPLINKSSGWINGGFFVLSTKIFKFIKNDHTIWEREPLEKISKIKELKPFKHERFWIAMDTIRDKKDIEELIRIKKAPWIKW